jgi:hypothetical protein
MIVTTFKTDRKWNKGYGLYASDSTETSGELVSEQGNEISSSNSEEKFLE